jgi:hypothetical protein
MVQLCEQRGGGDTFVKMEGGVQGALPLSKTQKDSSLVSSSRIMVSVSVGMAVSIVVTSSGFLAMRGAFSGPSLRRVV